VNITFFGTPDFAANLVKELIKKSYPITCIVSKPDKPKGRRLKLQPTAVKLVAQEFNISLLQPEKASSSEFISEMQSNSPDLFVVASYGEIMKPELLAIPKLGAINVHTSLLPKYRGAAPIQRCLIDGEEETGVSIMYMVKKLDAGDVICQEKISLSKEMTSGSLEENLCDLGVKALSGVLDKLLLGEKLVSFPQDEAKVTYAKKILPSECYFDWDKPVEDLHNLIRGVSPLPGAWTYCNVRGERKRLKVLKSSIESLEKGLSPGSIVSFGKEGWTVACGSGVLRLIEVQLEGKRPLKVLDFVRGFSSDLISF
jgi:methionyl-tRNA formyltransferase